MWRDIETPLAPEILRYAISLRLQATEDKRIRMNQFKAEKL
jgi:hypothetical protein